VLLPLVTAISYAFWALQLLVLARVIISWVPSVRYHPLAQWITSVTDPMLRPFRAMVPVGAGGVDFSPMILLIVLWIAQRMILALLPSGVAR